MTILPTIPCSMSEGSSERHKTVTGPIRHVTADRIGSVEPARSVPSGTQDDLCG